MQTRTLSHLEKLRRDIAIIKALRESDDYKQHARTFFVAARQLIDDNLITLEEIEINGGFVRKSKVWGIYFITRERDYKKFYLNTITKEIM